MSYLTVNFIEQFDKIGESIWNMSFDERSNYDLIETNLRSLILNEAEKMGSEC